jgi:hypothetical protein
MQSWFFLVVSLNSDEFQRVNDLRQRPEKPLACALQIAKQVDYSPKAGTLMTFSPRWRSAMPCLWSPKKAARTRFKCMDTRIRGYDGY